MFKCSKNLDIGKFLKNSACRHEKECISRTYLLIESYDDPRIRAYITLAIKCIKIKEGLGPVELDRLMNINHGIAQSYLIGQLAKANREPEGVAPSLIKIAISILNKVQEIIGCRIVRLDCEDVLISLYEKK